MQLTKQQREELKEWGFDVEEKDDSTLVYDYVCTDVSEIADDVSFIISGGIRLPILDNGVDEDAQGVERAWIMI